jgi:pyridoxine 4-dehydrogenase
LALREEGAIRPGQEVRDHRISVMSVHLPDHQHGAMDPAPIPYAIRVNGHLGATVLSAFPAMAAEPQGAQTVLTGLLDQSALYGVLAGIEALGLDLVEVRQLGQPTENGVIMSDAAVSVESSGRFAIGRWRVHRVGFGAMQLAGDGVFGPPRDRAEALAVLRQAIADGVDHIDTAQYYGPGVVNELIREALHPYPSGLAIVSKVAARRDDTGAVLRYDEPHQLRQGIEDNLRTLGIDRLAAVNLRLIDGSIPGPRFEAQLDAMIQARDEGLIDGIGLSNITRDHLLRAISITEIVCVQNLFNLAERQSLALLRECRRREIAFVPYCPLGYPRSERDRILQHPRVITIAARHRASPAQVALAWLLGVAPNVLLIPGTRTRDHLAENLGAGSVKLDSEATRELTEHFFG